MPLWSHFIEMKIEDQRGKTTLLRLIDKKGESRLQLHQADCRALSELLWGPASQGLLPIHSAWHWLSLVLSSWLITYLPAHSRQNAICQAARLFPRLQDSCPRMSKLQPGSVALRCLVYITQSRTTQVDRIQCQRPLAPLQKNLSMLRYQGTVAPTSYPERPENLGSQGHPN